MATSTTLRRLGIGAFAGASLMVGGPPAGLTAQEGCVFGDDGNDVYQRQTVPGGGSITYVTRPHFVCDDGVQIWADSAVAYMPESLSHLIGRVRYLDRTRELTASEARYFSDVGRLQASGQVVVVDREDGSRVENGDLVYLRQTDFRPEESMTVTIGRDGVRPRATVLPPPSDSAAAEPEPATPYTVVGDRIVFRGDSYFSADGTVEIERDSLLAFGDSLEYEETSDRLVLVGSARVESAAYILVGRTITIGTAETGPNEIRAVREATLTGNDLLVTAPDIRLYALDNRIERLVAVPLAREDAGASQGPATGVPGTGAGAPAAGDVAEPDSADLARPVALAESFELTADSLELSAPGEVVERIFAGGRARSVSQARDSLNVDLLPELARSDWLEGDTIVITLSQRFVTEPPSPGGGDSLHANEPAREYEVERIVARVSARSLYRLVPEDSTARAGIDPPAVHYVVGDEITIHMRDGEVESMEVVGQTSGWHLEPLRRPPEAAPDSLAAPADSVPAPPDIVPAVPGRRR